MKINEAKLKYTCPAVCPKNIYLDRIYSLGKDKDGIYFTDGNYVQHSDIEFIKMLFTPTNCNWKDVEFEDKKKVTKIINEVKVDEGV
jgi:hypothetical protein